MDAQNKPVLAVFDFDGTLTVCDSLLPFLRRSFGFAGFWIRIAQGLPNLFLYAIGLRDNALAKAKLLSTFFANQSVECFERKCERFAAGDLLRLLNPKAMGKLRSHQSSGHRIILLSASPEGYLIPWAQAQGVSTALATKLEIRDGKLTGRLEGLNCHGQEKITRLKASVGDLEQYYIIAYGDSRSDRPLLELADEGRYRAFDDYTGARRVLACGIQLCKALL